MQWNWLVRTKLLLAGLALAVVMGDSIAGPFANRRNNRNGSSDGQWMPVDQGTMTTQAGQPTQPTTVATQVQPTEQPGQWVTEPAGRRGRRTVQVWQPAPVTQVVQQQPQPMPNPGQAAAGQPAAEQPAAGQPAAQAAPMPSTTQGAPVVQSAQPTYQPIANQRRGLLGRRRGNDNGGYSYAPDMTAANPQGTVQPGMTRQSFYPANGQTALIDVRVPVANAQISFDGTGTVQQGISRVFVTPALNPQGANTYEVKASWTGQNGAPIERTQTVKVTPGGRVLVNFTNQQQ